MSLVQAHQGAPKTAELVAQVLARKYGPFRADNTAANRSAIIATLTWIAGTGIRYDYARAAPTVKDTLSPNATLSRGAGMCRDTHAAVGAILSSLMTAERSGDGFKPGHTASGDISVIGFSTPKEDHVFLTYRDPVSGQWNALEYGMHYLLNAPSDVEAAAALPGALAVAERYQLRGFDGAPSIAGRTLVDARVLIDFFSGNEGTGKAGELRLSLDPSGGRASYFLGSGTSLSALAVIRGAQPAGAVKINLHEDLTEGSRRGYLHLAGGIGVVSTAVSQTGQRAAIVRVRIPQLIVSASADARIEKNAVTRPSFALSFAVDAKASDGIAIALSGATASPTDATSYTVLAYGSDVTAKFAFRLSDTATLELAVRGRHDIDLHALLGNIQMTGADALGLVLLRGQLRAGAALHGTNGGVRYRLEAAAQQQLSLSPLQAPLVHSWMLSVGDDAQKWRLDTALLGVGPKLDSVRVQGALRFGRGHEVRVGVGGAKQGDTLSGSVDGNVVVLF